jgi:mRNA-degrading endonuclease YafQ of YafQ-DinJ toxin-antitoxin module
VTHVLLRSTAFVRDAKRLLRKRPDLAEPLRLLARVLQLDPFAARLRTHKLKGALGGSWACSGGYDLRVVFSFTKYERKPAILLESVGTHDDVY